MNSAKCARAIEEIVRRGEFSIKPFQQDPYDSPTLRQVTQHPR
jgi:hypothetical protein